MQAFDEFPFATIEIAPDSEIIRFNEMADKLFHLSSLCSADNPALFCNLIDKEDKPSFVNFLQNGGTFPSDQYNTTLTSKNDRKVPITTTLSQTGNGNFFLYLKKSNAIKTDCSVPCFQNQFLKAQYQSNPCGVLIINDRREILSFNPEFINLWDIPEDIQQRKDSSRYLIHILGKLEKKVHYFKKILELEQDTTKSASEEVSLNNGKVLYIHTYPLFSATQYLGRSWNFIDITELHLAREKLYFMAHHDTLTGLPNRRLFHNILRQAIANSQRSGTMVGVLFIDLDNFKAINDTFGHEKGDLLLKDTAQTIRTCLRESDMVCRWGGDEFVVALPELKTANDAEFVADKLREAIVEKYILEYRDFQLSASIGIAMFPKHSSRPDRLIRNADNAMYLAKRNGKNRFFLFEPNDYKR